MKVGIAVNRPSRPRREKCSFGWDESSEDEEK